MKCPAVASGAEHHGFGAHGMDFAGQDIHGYQAPADVVLHDQIHTVPFAVKFDSMPQGLLVNRVKQHMAGIVSRIIRPRGRMAAKPPLGDPPIGQPAEDAAHMLVSIDNFRRLPDHDLDRVLVPQPIRSFNRVKHMQIKAVNQLLIRRNHLERPARACAGHRADVVQRCGDPPLGRAAVGAQRVDLRQDPDILHPLLRRRHSRPGSCQAGADHDHIMRYRL